VRNIGGNTISNAGGSIELDEVDRVILKSLRENSRMSLQEISRKAGVSDATIQFRLKRMKANGVIERFTISTNPAATGYVVTAIILVQTDGDRHDQVLKDLTGIQEIIEVYGILGEYDLFLKVWSKSLEELNSIINDRIRSLEGIEDLHEIVVMERAKDEMPPV
jgi:Lrp/AsnC family transcriptional regulator for asnA, asnC and gidA